MKKIALISAATAATFAFAPNAFADQPVQKLEVSIGAKTAGTTKKPVATKLTFNTGTTSTNADGTKQTIKYAKITLPKGIKLNYQAFPECDETHGADETYTCQDSAPKAAIGSGTATASVTDIDYPVPGTLTPFIGSGGRLIIRTFFEGPPAYLDKGLVGKISTSGGAYSFDFNVPESLQVPLPNTLQQISEFKINFAKKTAKKGKKTIGLIELTSCPKAGYVFKGHFDFRDGTSAEASTTVKCKAAKK